MSGSSALRSNLPPRWLSLFIKIFQDPRYRIGNQNIKLRPKKNTTSAHRKVKIRSKNPIPLDFVNYLSLEFYLSRDNLLFSWSCLSCVTFPSSSLRWSLIPAACIFKFLAPSSKSCSALARSAFTLSSFIYLFLSRYLSSLNKASESSICCFFLLR